MLLKNPLKAICLCISLMFYGILGWSQDCSDPNVGIIMDIGEDFSLSFGESRIIQVLFATLTPIETVEWSPNEGNCNSDPLDSDCFDFLVQPLVSTCYTLNLTNINGCSATDEICVAVDNCEVFIANSLVDIVLDTPNNMIDLKLEIMRTQVFNIEISQNSDIIFETRKSLHKGLNNVSLSTATLEPGEYQINLDLFPDPISSSFTKQ